VILLNTCAIREHAEARVPRPPARARGRHKRRRPDVRLGVTGCMAQHLREKLVPAARPWVDLLVGPDGYRRLPELLRGGDGDPHLALRPRSVRDLRRPPRGRARAACAPGSR